MIVVVGRGVGEGRAYHDVRERAVLFPGVAVVYAHHAVDVELVIT